MKIVFLNALDAQVTEPLRTFLQTHAPDTDVFCFQECYQNMRELIVQTLPQFIGHRASKPVLHDSVFTNVTLVRNTHTIIATSSNTDTKNTGLCLFSTIRYKNTEVHIANMHGLSKPGKLDNPDRLEQSQELIDAFATRSGVKIIGGDLNVLLETKSVSLFEEADYTNLIKKFGIKTTRNTIAWANYPGNELYHSDYVFVKDAKVDSFEVPGEIVSDHQPMILTINL